jgi:hypothetical protein
MQNYLVLYIARTEKSHPSGAKAHDIFYAVRGTTEVVPCYKAWPVCGTTEVVR